jgi:hypothetical protein
MNLTDRLITAIVEKCDGLSITAEQASNILAYLQYGAPMNSDTTNTGAASLSDEQIENGWRDTFSTDNPYCPCNLKSFTKAVRWAERHIATTPQADAAPSADDAWESYLAEQKLIIGMPGLHARSSFIAGYRAAIAAGRNRSLSGISIENAPQLSEGQQALSFAIGRLHIAASPLTHSANVAGLIQEAIDRLNWLGANPELLAR